MVVPPCVISAISDADEVLEMLFSESVNVSTDRNLLFAKRDVT